MAGSRSCIASITVPGAIPFWLNAKKAAPGKFNVIVLGEVTNSRLLDTAKCSSVSRFSITVTEPVRELFVSTTVVRLGMSASTERDPDNRLDASESETMCGFRANESRGPDKWFLSSIKYFKDERAEIGASVPES